MLFDMREEEGAITGWVAPDNPAKRPKVRLISGDAAAIEMLSNESRPDVRDQGLHPTGEVGFRIDETIFPELTGRFHELEVREGDTDVLLYKRFDPNRHIQTKLFGLELRALPCLKTEADWRNNFALVYNAVERYPFDTMFSILNNPAASSIMIAGRLAWFRYASYLQSSGFKIVTLLRDPMEELAERLMFVQYLASPNADPRYFAYATGLSSLSLAVRDLRFDNPRSLSLFFSSLSFQQKQALGNPYIKLLGCGLNEEPSRHHVEIALSRLAEVDVVGVQSYEPQFRQLVEELVGRKVFTEVRSTQINFVREIARALAGMSEAVSLVAYDLELYGLVKNAVEKVCAAGL